MNSPTLHPGGLARETTRRQRIHELAAATFNVENLSPLASAEKFAALAHQIVGNLAAPDVVALEEIQDNSGPANDGVVAADQTLAKLVAAITAAGGPRYSARSIDPLDGTDGGQPGGNIRQAFLFRSDRGLSFVDRPGGDATTPMTVGAGGGRARLSVSPGRIDPANPAFANSRKPLAGEFRWYGQPVYVVANHFNSKGGDQPLFGRFQPPARPSEAQRHAQAAAVRGFVDEIQAIDQHANVVVLGDINDFDFSQTTDILVGDGSMVDLPRTVPLPERYTYVFQATRRCSTTSSSPAGHGATAAVLLLADVRLRHRPHQQRVRRSGLRPRSAGRTADRELPLDRGARPARGPAVPSHVAGGGVFAGHAGAVRSVDGSGHRIG